MFIQDKSHIMWREIYQQKQYHPEGRWPFLNEQGRQIARVLEADNDALYRPIHEAVNM